MKTVQASADSGAAALTLEALLADVRARREEIEALRHVPQDIVDGLRAVGLYRANVPTSLGGEGRPLADVLRLIERISEADASVGWVASFAPQGANYMGALAPHRLREIYANGPDVVGAGGLFPLQPAERVPGGLLVNGRWKFGSGCMGADWLSVGVVIPGEGGDPPPPRLLVLPAEKVEIVDNWNTVGLAGTGSHDLVVRDVVAEEDWSFIRGGPTNSDEPICRFPSLALAALCFAVVGLGAGQAAVGAIRELAGKKSITGAPRLGDRSYAQIGIARAEVQLQAARALLYDKVEAAWASIVAGDDLPNEDRALLRLAANHASRTGVDVTQACFGLAGTTSIFLDNPMQRYLRDALVVNQHAFLSEGHYESAGRIMMGMPSIPGFP